MSYGKPAFEVLRKAMLNDSTYSNRLYDTLHKDHPVVKYWGEIGSGVSTHDNEQDDIILLLNEAFESMEESE